VCSLVAYISDGEMITNTGALGRRLPLSALLLRLRAATDGGASGSSSPPHPGHNGASDALTRGRSYSPSCIFMRLHKMSRPPARRVRPRRSHPRATEGRFMQDLASELPRISLPRTPVNNIATSRNGVLGDCPTPTMRAALYATAVLWSRCRSGRLAGDHDGVGPRSRPQDAAFPVARQAIPNVEPARPPRPPLVLFGLEGLGVIEDAHGQVGLSRQPLVFEGDRGAARPAEGPVDPR
jgi:hypothetical protein